MPDNSSSRVPGELSLKALLLTAVAFFVADFAMYRGFSKLFPPLSPQPPTVQSSFDQKIGDLQQQLAIIQQRLTTLDAQTNATKAMSNNAHRSPGGSNNVNASRQELEKLKAEIHQLQQKCCNASKPCKQ